MIKIINNFSCIAMFSWKSDSPWKYVPISTKKSLSFRTLSKSSSFDDNIFDKSNHQEAIQESHLTDSDKDAYIYNLFLYMLYWIEF